MRPAMPPSRSWINVTPAGGWGEKGKKCAQARSGPETNALLWRLRTVPRFCIDAPMPAEILAHGLGGPNPRGPPLIRANAAGCDARRLNERAALAAHFSFAGFANLMIDHRLSSGLDAGIVGLWPTA